MINENEAQTASGRGTVRKKRRNRQNTENEPEQIAFPKKRKRKPHSGSNSYIEPAEHVATRKRRRGKPSAGHTDPRDLMQEDDNVVKREKQKKQSESNKCIEFEQNSSSCLPLSTLCMSTNYEVESFCSSLAIKRKKNPKQCSKRRVHTELGEQQKSVCSENSVFSGGNDGAEVMQNGQVEVDIPVAGDPSRKKGTAKPGSKRKKCTNLSTSQSSKITGAEGLENLSSNKKRGNSSLGQQHNRRRKSNEPSGDYDDITLASFYQDKVKKRIPSVTNEDEKTLASFLRKKSKKRRHEIVENAHLSILKEVDQTETGSSHEVVGKPGMINPRSALLADDITLACLRKRLKKREGG